MQWRRRRGSCRYTRRSRCTATSARSGNLARHLVSCRSMPASHRAKRYTTASTSSYSMHWQSSKFYAPSPRSGGSLLAISRTFSIFLAYATSRNPWQHRATHRPNLVCETLCQMSRPMPAYVVHDFGSGSVPSFCMRKVKMLQIDQRMPQHVAR